MISRRLINRASKQHNTSSLAQLTSTALQLNPKQLLNGRAQETNLLPGTRQSRESSTLLPMSGPHALFSSQANARPPDTQTARPLQYTHTPGCTACLTTYTPLQLSILPYRASGCTFFSCCATQQQLLGTNLVQPDEQPWTRAGHITLHTAAAASTYVLLLP